MIRNAMSTATNHRATCVKTMEQIKDHKPWFGIEQEYTLFGRDRRPLGWPLDGVLPPQGGDVQVYVLNKLNDWFWLLCFD